MIYYIRPVSLASVEESPANCLTRFFQLTATLHHLQATK